MMSALRRRFQLEWRGVGEARGVTLWSKAVATRGGSDPLLLVVLVIVRREKYADFSQQTALPFVCHRFILTGSIPTRWHEKYADPVSLILTGLLPMPCAEFVVGLQPEVCVCVFVFSKVPFGASGASPSCPCRRYVLCM